MERASSLATETTDLRGDPSAVNVLASHGTDRADTTRLDADKSCYSGVGAGAIGRLHAATNAVETAEHACLHHPSADHAAAGPWLVVEPLGGRISTVHRGSGTVAVTCTPVGGGVDARLSAVRDQVETVIEAARPTHEFYPVHRDDMGTFTTGMTTFALQRVEVNNGQAIVTFGVATTPRTERTEVVSRFDSLEPVSSVTYEADRPVAEGNPGTQLRAAVEKAAETVLGDWSYEWGPEPTAFSTIPSRQKVALGTGMPGAEECTLETVEACRRLLTESLDAVEGNR